jgi:hypothetical protein
VVREEGIFLKIDRHTEDPVIVALKRLRDQLTEWRADLDKVVGSEPIDVRRAEPDPDGRS